ncbi:MAG: recombinase family protein [Bdellovibrionaceae bacterium]|nr:recombinase family protein [Pseudobdellovibrionaceae bacterium]
MDLRPSNRVRNSLPTNIKRPHIGVSPYGYCIIRGSLVEVPKEQEVIRLVLKLRSENKTLSAIAEHLNKHRVKPRNAKRWDHSTVNSIIKRNIKKQSKEDHYDSK